MSPVRVYLVEDAPAEAVFRFEPTPDELWRAIFEEGLEDALGGRVRLEDGRLCVRKIDSLVEGLNGWWVNALNLRALATNTEWRRRQASGETELPRPRRPGFRLEDDLLVWR